jgi:hypothetical protein
MKKPTPSPPAPTSAGNTLLARFQQLQAACIKHDDDFVAGAIKVHSDLARAFVLYMEFEKQPAALGALYQRDGIQLSGRSDASKFTPFLKVLFRLDLPNPTADDIKRYRLTPKSMRNRVSHYAAVLDVLEKEHSARPHDFAQQTVEKLVQVIEDNGGIIGIVKARAGAHDNDNDSQRGNAGAQAAAADDYALTKEWIADHALDLLRSTVLGSASMNRPGVPGQMSACVLVVTQSGQFELRAASNDNSIVQTILTEQASRLSGVADDTLRTLGEVIATQCFPAAFCPSGRRASLEGKYKSFYEGIYLDESEDPEAGPACRRLVVREDSILLSAMRTKASVVTLLKPSQPLLGQKAMPVFLDLDQLRLLEDWLVTGTMPARTVAKSGTLLPPCKAKTDTRSIDVLNQATGKKDKLIFNCVGRPQDATASCYQPDFPGAGLIPEWSFAVSKAWLESLRDTFLTPWFTKTASGKKLNRRAHWTFKIIVTKADITFGFELDEESGKNPQSKMSLPTPAVLKRAQTFYVGTKDIAPILHNIADLDLDGDITVSGDADLVMLNFKTGIGDYTIAIPTAAAGKHGVERHRSHRMVEFK